MVGPGSEPATFAFPVSHANYCAALSCIIGQRRSLVLVTFKFNLAKREKKFFVKETEFGDMSSVSVDTLDLMRTRSS